jgi:hypothetical protein
MSIFNEENKVKGSWMKFNKIGDSIEGTFIAKREVPSRLNNDELQNVYEIKVSGKVIMDGVEQQSNDGDIWFVGGKKFIDNQMRHIRVGQIIGLRYESNVPSKRPGLSPLKVIQTYANASVVDIDWLESQDAMETAENVEYAQPAPVANNKKKEEDFIKDLDEIDLENKRQLIAKLAQQKLGASSDMEDVKMKVMEATKKAFIDQNLEEIISALKAL